MKVTFYSNFLNHHQLPFCKEMINMLGNNFKFVATEKIPTERINLGYEDMNDKYDFVIKEYENKDEALLLAKESDVILIGNAPNKYIQTAIKNNKLCFRYSERIYKEGFSIKKWLSLIKNITFREHKNCYLLCSSAYTSNDFRKSLAYINKTYKWGYFPEVKKYESIEKIMMWKNDNTILWVARFIDWKHPEIIVELANKLKNKGYKFNIKMIGIGPLEDSIKEMIYNYNLEDNILLMGSMPPEEVRKEMELSQIFIFTSDRNEGWGAVLNEAMNSACAVVANSAIGSVPFLIKNKENGLIYENGNFDDLYSCVTSLLNNVKTCNKLGENAYYTMLNTWNPKLAAQRFIKLSKSLNTSKKSNIFEDGPCSKAYIIKDNWYKKGGKII